MITIIRDYTLEDVKASLKDFLEKAANSEEVRELGVKIVYGQQDHIAAVYTWVKSNVDYIPDPEGIELITSPVKMVRDYNEGKPLAEDCDGMAILTTALYRSVGIKSNVVLLDTVGEGYDHAVSRAYSDKLGSWIIADVSTSKIPLGWEISHVRRLMI